MRFLRTGSYSVILKNSHLALACSASFLSFYVSYVVYSNINVFSASTKDREENLEDTKFVLFFRKFCDRIVGV